MDEVDELLRRANTTPNDTLEVDIASGVVTVIDHAQPKPWEEIPTKQIETRP